MYEASRTKKVGLCRGTIFLGRKKIVCEVRYIIQSMKYKYIHKVITGREKTLMSQMKIKSHP